MSIKPCNCRRGPIGRCDLGEHGGNIHAARVGSVWVVIEVKRGKVLKVHGYRTEKPDVPAKEKR